jgi:hypothetical protein
MNAYIACRTEVNGNKCISTLNVLFIFLLNSVFWCQNKDTKGLWKLGFRSEFSRMNLSYVQRISFL